MSHHKVSKQQEKHARAHRTLQRRRMTTIGLIALGSVIFVSAILYSQIKSIGAIMTVTPPVIPNPNELSMGDPSAPIQVDVFEDFQCPACKYFTEEVETLLAQNYVATGKVRYTFHQYPFLDGDETNSGGESDQAANASMCANEQGKFWEMHHTLYANWNGENQGNFSDRRLQAMAEQVGLDMAAFNSCFNANKYQADIQADYDKGNAMGVDGTPSIFVNGVKVGQPGRIPTYEEIAQAIEEALNAIQ